MSGGPSSKPKQQKYFVKFGALKIHVTKASPNTESLSQDPDDPGPLEIETEFEKRSTHDELMEHEDLINELDILPEAFLPEASTTVPFSTFEVPQLSPTVPNSSTPLWTEGLHDSIRAVLEDRVETKVKEESVATWASASQGPTSFFQTTDIRTEEAVLCWCCATPMSLQMFRLFPKVLPYRFQTSTAYFLVRGFFCSWECVRLYLIERGDTNVLSILAIFLQKLYGRVIRLRPHCSRLKLKQFGGDVSIEEFSSSMDACNKERVWHRLEWHPTIENCCRVWTQHRARREGGAPYFMKNEAAGAPDESTEMICN